MTRAAAIALSHGGGPLIALGDAGPGQANIAKSLQTRVPEILRLHSKARPRAMVVVTAHWSERYPTISSSQKHSLYYDYSGFPPEAYRLKYGAPGAPTVALEVAQAMTEVGLEPKLDEERGWDHGVFVPLLIIRPEADIPIVQVSVLESGSPETHIAMGRALSKLRDSNVAIIGSGFASFHNVPAIFSGATLQTDFRLRNDEWSQAINDALREPDLTTRHAKLQKWRSFPNSYDMHPPNRAEHFLPFLVTVGAGGDAVPKSYVDESVGLDMFSYYWD